MADMSTYVADYTTYSGWRQAVRKIDPNARFEGNIEIANAFGEGILEAHWDGAQGVIEWTQAAQTRVQASNRGETVVLGPMSTPALLAALISERHRASGAYKQALVDIYQEVVRSIGETTEIELDTSSFTQPQARTDFTIAVNTDGAVETYNAFEWSVRNEGIDPNQYVWG